MSKIQLNPVSINEDYAKKWNERSTDFVHVCINNNLVSETLYRKGGLFSEKSMNDRYIQILKYVEEMYEDDITKDPKRKPHLAGYWCAIDTETGEEVYVDSGKSLSKFYITAGCVGSIDRKYFNFVTGEVYCKSLSNISKTKDYLFIETGYNDDFRGVLQIDHKTGIVTNKFEK